MVYIRTKCHVPTIQRFTGFHHETERCIKLSNDYQDIIIHFTENLILQTFYLAAKEEHPLQVI
jgi:hypothetical protein